MKQRLPIAKTISKTFVNERGNKITASGKRVGKDLVNIKLKGPKSVSDNTITIEEAKKIKTIITKLVKD